jgi:aminoglycoside phosphotransferase (APT) family kinase protein
MWSSLNRLDIDPDDPSYSDVRRRVLGRLGEYASLAIGPLNLRPTAATLLREDNQRVELRVSTPSSHVVLVIAADGDLMPEVFWLRALAASNLPIPRLITHDLSLTTLPFAYALESYIGGSPLDWLEDGPRMRVLARQAGRTLRRAHQVAAPGYGRPAPTGRWPAASWPAALGGWLARRETLARAEEALGLECAVALIDATIDHPALACAWPCVIHGAVEPDHMIVTVGDTMQLEALTRPGELVGGDPIFDLAHGLLPRHPATFRQGLIEGYSASGPLDAEQQGRLRRLGLLLLAADTLQNGDAAALARLPDEIAAGLRELG